MSQHDHAAWAGRLTPVGTGREEPPPQQQRGLPDQGSEAHAEDTARRACRANDPTPPPLTKAQHPLLQACMCRLAPMANCMACARWRQHYGTLTARRLAAGQHQRPAAPPAPRRGS